MRQSAGYSLARAKAAGGRNSQFQKASPGCGAPFQSANAFRSHDKTPNTSALLRKGRGRGGAHATVGRAQSGNPKAGACQKFHKHVAAEASADGSRKCPAKTSEKVRPFADVQSPNVARFSSFGNKKETLPCRRASFCLPPFRMFSALVARRKIVVSF